MNDTPDVRELLPHAGPMVLINRVLRHDECETVCLVAEHDLFRDADGSVPAWIGLEYMAQCVALHGALHGHLQRASRQIGWLVSARAVSFHADRFQADQQVEVSARSLHAGAGGLVTFSCTIRDSTTGAPLAEGRLGCVVSQELPEGSA